MNEFNLYGKSTQAFADKIRSLYGQISADLYNSYTDKSPLINMVELSQEVNKIKNDKTHPLNNNIFLKTAR